jgi:predicted dehydrogenase
MIKVALIGAGKMGISHLAILGAHPDVEVVGVVDTSKLVIDVLQKYSAFQCFDDYKKMLTITKPDAVFVAVPTKYHASIVQDLLNEGIHVFVEKPFCIDINEGYDLVELAEKKRLVNQVGYHNKFVGTFEEVKKIIEQGYIGDVLHFSGEMNGPVVVKRKQDNWRSKPEEGGGCLMDYAAHIIDLINYLIAPVVNVRGAILKSFYSKSVEDAVFTLLETENNITGVLNVNWSDETYRKMSTVLTIIGSKGKVIVDSTELKIYFKESDTLHPYTKGWNIRHINDFAEKVDFYLRGEEYSAQIDYFVKSVEGKVPNNKNTFKTAWVTDTVIDKIRNF